MEALAISPREIIESQECLPEEGKHCAILAVTTLYRAIADFLLQAIQDRPQDADLHAQLGRLYQTQGDLPAAIEGEDPCP